MLELQDAEYVLHRRANNGLLLKPIFRVIFRSFIIKICVNIWICESILTYLSLNKVPLQKLLLLAWLNAKNGKTAGWLPIPPIIFGSMLNPWLLEMVKMARVQIIFNIMAWLTWGVCFATGWNLNYIAPINTNEQCYLFLIIIIGTKTAWVREGVFSKSSDLFELSRFFFHQFFFQTIILGKLFTAQGSDFFDWYIYYHKYNLNWLLF